MSCILTRTRSMLVGSRVAHFCRGRFLRRAWLLGLALTCGMLLFNSSPLFSQTPPAAQTETEAEPETDKAVLEQILSCLEKGQEAVLLQNEPVKCAPSGKGIKVAASSLENVNIARICHDPGDLRRLSGNAIKLVARQKDRIDSTGIRVIGGVYC